ncbi:MAG: hypothetical protein QOD39_1875, partial [Mycobacterium sp.]|nr:hypothetical protein [Mycobacterium sp.]
MASEQGLPASLPRRRSLVRRVLRAIVIGVVSLLLVVAIAIAAMVRPDIPLETLLPKYGAAPSKFVEIEGMRIHYRDEGTGLPLVLVHGFGSSLFTWGWLGARARRQAAAHPPRPARFRADWAGTRRRLPSRTICPRHRGAARFARRP